jgi:cell pole-organizing protein PopZ
MSAANASAPSPSLQDEMRAHEPSMEEILASIRRIIADDEQLATTGRESRRREAAEETRPGLRDSYPAPALDPAPEIDPVVEVAPRAPPVTDIRQRLNRPAPEPVEAAVPVEDDEKEIDEVLAVAAPEAVRETSSLRPSARDEALLSTDAASSVASHFEALTTSLFLNESGLLEKYAQDMLRPMLKQWLDDNLPVIVERLVRAEIERVARGPRR